MNLPSIILVAAALALLAVLLILVWRSRRRVRARVAARERGELEARVAQRVRSISDSDEIEEDPALRVAPRVTTGPVSAASESAEPAVEPTPPRMVPIAGPDMDRIYAPRRPQPEVTEAVPPVESPAPKPTPAAMDARPAVSTTPVRRASVRADEPPRRRRRTLVPAAAAVLVLVVVILAAGPVLRALVGSGPVATSTPTEIAAQPTPTVQATPSPSPTPEPTPSPTPQATPTPPPPPGGTPLPTPHVYVVRSGDTLWQIAMTFKIDLSQLIAANPQIKDPSVILPGEQVTIPTPTPAP